MSELSTEDADLLQRAIDTIEASDSSDSNDTAPFRSMLGRGRALSPKQRAWAESVATGKHVEAEPECENLVSRGLVPRGREVAPPTALRRENLPLKPPTRRPT